MIKRNPVKINAPYVFKEFLYRKKAEEPDKTLQQIMEDIAKTHGKKKAKEFFPKW